MQKSVSPFTMWILALELSSSGMEAIALQVDPPCGLDLDSSQKGPSHLIDKREIK